MDGHLLIQGSIDIPKLASRLTSDTALRLQGEVSQRNGATQWGVFEDLDQPGRWVESFVVDSSTEMERIRQRTTAADYAILQRLYALHQGAGNAPSIGRFLAAPSVS